MIRVQGIPTFIFTKKSGFYKTNLLHQVLVHLRLKNFKTSSKFKMNFYFESD
ncbi:hypothetical protein LEP1GSC173_2004 [Leptospira interrogans str. HAI1594]|uniref:Uncharacterized protein n=4 Tax=Leptospira interrogans TaxID=173 RepID=A0A0E2D1M9_LEPIR|nr:hypothetical protein LEP1GSC080_0917 [Leptospira interrogans str. FPW2026]EKO26499.1 hypothetical protein LEP1GSC104_3042 [Leptospira interrogans str. UI 12621]EKO85824.1 hypothetical protein LEP1GSC009_2478 [Leptospira interrogans serovar Grippotyphosa str. Andaman]EKP20482.1 hypothetical protein LEP1GSC117_2338 [Leptospira interrogans serovar Icterohaemorrhagiae str. Verdun LP]EKP74711.1 hypothetical protein LEP1GSC173_2004 [Leptospira interrogans str. HAI1594]EKR24955.1 hypothetical prot